MEQATLPVIHSDTSTHNCCKLCVEIAWKRIFQLPVDLHRAFPSVSDISSGSEKPKCTIALIEACKQHDFTPLIHVLLITNSCFAVCTGYRLTLPVNTLTRNRIIFVSRRGGEITFRFIQGEGQQVSFCLGQPAHTFPPGRDLHRVVVTIAKCGEKFDPRILCMYLLRDN